ncbi:FYVE, RhoGEF and PH domain-containing protein 5-like isoform X2 [Brienomyrus brachyistius]|uniref:FYVE, RhoGEF and PH domain-containing protein 5-like isoform X2 n=1 Tax=Brienomyrus brachyistius TaxID=42636 RepID=UPI0020B3D3B8|nr:FYVE, RhoGEF and PH domain-containing protein 5-like isoform X2 [Brienomyrus brachyistius]
MNTEYLKSPHSSKPRILNHLTIRLPSTLMSRPCIVPQGARPPIAPKPSLLHNSAQPEKEEGCPHANGHLDSEEDHELNACQETRVQLGRHVVESCDEEEQLTETLYGNEVKEEKVEEESELKAQGLNLINSVEMEGSDFADMVEVCDAESMPESLDSAEISDLEDMESLEPWSNNAEEEVPQADELPNHSMAFDKHESASESSHEHEIGHLQGNESPFKDGDKIQNDPEETTDELCSEGESDLQSAPSQEDCSEGCLPCHRFTVGGELSVVLDFCRVPLSLDECTYDVIGPPCDTDSAQPETLTDNTDKSQVFQDTWEGFQPYSVIESVPGEDVLNTTDINRNISSTSEGLDPACNSNLEPYYVSANEVNDVDESQANPNQCVSPESGHPGVANVNSNEESGQAKEDDYADIDEAGNLDQLECPSSEDYVEIGDDEERVETEQKKSSKESKETGRPCLPLLNPRNCQPRFRLCAITVPADMDLSGTEHTNRLVLADTSDALEDDTDEEGHIVPYFEDLDTQRDNISDEHVYEEAGLDSEGENFLSLERKSIVTRSCSLSGKVPGYVPETVPEEPGTEYLTHDYYTVSVDESHSILRISEDVDFNHVVPSSKHRGFNIYPRSFSMEGRDMPMNAYREHECSPGEKGRMKRIDDNLSLPCVITSSGSFSQKSHQASSGMSTPTSVVDIPPPFELAYITKKPITKSSPSLLIENDSPEKQNKKKTSFKRFLALKFKRKTESKDTNFPSSRSSSESSHHGPFRFRAMEKKSAGSSPQLLCKSGKLQRSSDSLTTFLFYNDGPCRKNTNKTNNRRVSRVESFEDRSGPPFMPLPLTKLRSISFPSADTSDYENIPAMNSDYENVPVPPRRPVRVGTFTEFFDDPNRGHSTSNENDGYVDMSSFAGFDSKPQTPEQDSESAYTEPYRVCPLSGRTVRETMVEEDQGRTSEDDDGCADHSYDRHTDGRSRAFYIAKDLVESEKIHVKGLRLLHEDFRAAVGGAAGEDGQPILEEEKLTEILNLLPEVYLLHCRLLDELENCMLQWEKSPRMADVFLTRQAEFSVFTPYVAQYDRNMALLDDSRHRSPAFSSIARQFEHQSPLGGNVPLKYQLLQVVIRILQYRMLLTDYLNNLSPDSKEYEDTQAALVIVSDVADQANDSLRQGENLLRLVNIEYSIRGQRDLLRPGRVFVKEGTLMKVSRKCRQPRHLFLMNDILLYTYPQQDGKYRLKNTLSLTGLKVSKPTIDNVQNVLKIETAEVSITLSASSCSEREDWFHSLSRTMADHARSLGVFGGSSSEPREKLWASLGEQPPTLVPVSHVMMCMCCSSDFSLTLRRHHCQACGKIVCRSCARNKYPLKYLRDRMGKVCDHCYAELRKRGGGIPGTVVGAGPQPSRTSRPLSAVFQNIYPPSLWRPRRSTSNLNQVAALTEGSTMSGTLQRRKRSKRNWKRLWFLIKDKVLYTFSTREDREAAESLPLRGFTVKLPEKPEGDEASSVFQLYHKKTLYCTFRAEDTHTARRWVNAMEEATVL